MKNTNKLMSNIQRLTSNTAITLIALIITIIVLLILAGVTSNMLMGENGIIQKAQLAKEKNETQGNEEENLKNIENVFNETCRENMKKFEKGEININFSHAWQTEKITLKENYDAVPSIYYYYGAVRSGGSVSIINITTSSFELWYNSFFSNLKSDTVKWIAFEE